ncbi:MAG: type II secretion system protein N [Gammaproteobacteria bacterium]|nr:type II secretion system protein N [Gammaproteobacteria bacterium]
MRAPATAMQRGRLPGPVVGLLILLVVIVGLFVLLLFAPAGVISMALERSGADGRLLAPAGRVHSGGGQLLIENRNFGAVSWRLRPAGLLRGRLDVDFTIRGAGYDAEARTRIGLGRQVVTGLEGQVTEAGLRALLEPYEIYPSGEFTLSDGRLEAQRDRLAEVHGDGHWTGGFVRYFLAGQGWTVEFPALDARLRLVEGQPLLVVLDPNGDELLDVRLDLDGWAHLRIRYRFIAMAGFPWPDGPAPETILIELSEQVL